MISDIRSVLTRPTGSHKLPQPTRQSNRTVGRSPATVSITAALVSLAIASPATLAAKNGVLEPTFPAIATGPQPIIPSQFDIIGHIQMATLDSQGTICHPTDPRLAGGLVTVNGTTITIPCNTVLQMPAASVTWAELFDPSLQPNYVASIAPGTGYNTITGLALVDAAYLNSPPLTTSSPDQPYPITPPAPVPNLTNIVPTTAGNPTLAFPLIPSYQIRVQGNIMPNGQYIAGLVFISQDSLNVSQGFIKSIDYTSGELCIATSKPSVGFAVQTIPNPVCAAPDVRVRPNDGPAEGALPFGTGRFGLSHGKPGSGAQVIETNLDPRFTVDQDNPTLHAESGYPMCIPRTFPFTTTSNGTVIQGIDDPRCPQSNRPIQVTGGGAAKLVRDPGTGGVIGSTGIGCQYLPPANGRPAINGKNFPVFPSQSVGKYCHTFVMDETPNYGACGTLSDGTVIPCTTNPLEQAPFEVGDYVSYSGTLTVSGAQDYPRLPQGASPYYISAHTIAGSLGIYTYPGKKPVYASIEGLLAGTNALAIANIPQEATSRVRVVGFVTDPSSLVDIFAMDVDFTSGVVNDRLLANSNPSGPPVIGRMKFEPAAGAYSPPPRGYRIVSRTLCNSNTLPCYYPQAGGLNPITGEPFGMAETAANGLKYGQYNAPNFEFVFPENVGIGDQIVANNFQDLAFLFCGSGPLTTPTAGDPIGSFAPNPVVGPLSPPPWDGSLPLPVNPYNTTQALCSSSLAVVPAAGPNAPITASQPRDQVRIINATWDNRRGKGKLTVRAYSNLQTGTVAAKPPTPNNLQLYVEAYDSLGVPMASAPLSMGLINQQLVNGLPVCGAAVPTGGQCFEFSTPGVILDPVASNLGDPTMANNQFASPAVGQITITDPFTNQPIILNGGIRVTSSRGGIAVTGDPGNLPVVRLRCNLAQGFTC